MSLAQGYPSTFSDTQSTIDVLRNLDNETKKIYEDVNTLMGSTGHAHTGNGTDGAVIGIYGGYKNKIINGNFSINQRAVSGTVTLAAGQYGHNNWKAGASGCTYTFVTVEGVTTVTIAAGSLLQVVEGVNLFTGTHVLSWQGTAQGKIGAGSYGISGTTGSVTGGTNINIEFGVGTLSLVQLEKGTIATLFEQRDITHETLLCQRTCFVATKANAEYVGASTPGLYGDADYIPVVVWFSSILANMRGAVSVSFVGTQGTDWAIVTSGGAVQTGFALSTNNNMFLTFVKSYHGVTNIFLRILTTSGKIIFSSEL